MSEELLARLNIDQLPWEIQDVALTDSMRLDGRVAVVTGAGGVSLGRAIAHRLASLGASIAAVDLRTDGAEQTAAQIRERWGVPAIALGCDVTKPDDVQRIVDEATQQLGPIEILVNNVGLPRRPGQTSFDFASLSTDDIDWFVATNLLGTMYCTRAVLQPMLANGRGRIINIASESGKSWTFRQTAYSTSKAGVIGFTRSLAHELAGSGVSTVAVCPGIMITRETIEVLRAIPEGVPNPIETSFQRVAAGRCSLPEEVANVVAFLASDAGRYVQGTAVSAGGGLSD